MTLLVEGRAIHDARAMAQPEPYVDPTTLPALDVEALRVPAERRVGEALKSIPGFESLAADATPPSADALRRALLASSLRLTETMAPDTWSVAHAARDVLRVTKPLEIYQSSGRENAAIHLIEEPVVLEVMGRFINLLDRGAALAVFGHELGHYLAHGPWTELGRLGLVAQTLVRGRNTPREIARVAGAMSMARELTADRFGLLACQDLAAHLRLEMICTTGLHGDALTWDTDAYLQQCRELVESVLSSGDRATGTTHPEHGVRAWAAWRFYETREFRALTGRGPGTGSLAEVDAQVERLLALPSLDGAWHLFDAPPPELDEGALAGCVLVAAADGAITEVEVDALERAFASRVKHLRAYLDPEYARARLDEVAPVLRAAGAGVLAALFFILMRVSAADGSIDAREIEVILQVGEFLDARPLFERLMRASLRVMRPALGDAPAQPAVAPLPPRGGEVQEALAVFLDGARRRGGGTVTLRRLLRLMGGERSTEELVRALEASLARASLTLDPPPAHDDLDAERTLQVVESADAPPSAPASTPRRDPSLLGAERAQVLRAVSALRDALVRQDGSSLSVRLRAPRGGRAVDLVDLDALSVGLAERALAQVRARRRARLVEPAEAGAHPAAKRAGDALLALDREARAIEEESGSRDLALGHPFLSGVVRGYFVRGPVVLHPVTLARDARGARGFTLVPSEDDPPTVNLALLRLVFSKLGHAFTEALRSALADAAADPAQSVEAVLGTLASVGLQTSRGDGALRALGPRDDIATWTGDRLELEDCAVLGLFPQSSSDLLQDYDQLIDALGDPGVDLATTLGCAAQLLPAELRGAIGDDDPRDSLTEGPELGPVLHADPSQRAVLARAAVARALVVDGPPGTGKSQVIVNLLADAVARGQRVAVVCEKRAALDVVAQRAQGVGLRHALALVHDVHTDRRALYAQVSARIETSELARFDEDEASRAVAERARVEEALRERSEALAAQGDRTTLCAGRLHALAAAIEAPVDVVVPALGGVAEGSLEALGDAMVALWPYADLYVPGERWAAMARPSYGDLDGRAVTALGDALARAQSSAEAHAALANTSPIAGAQLVPLAGALSEALAFCDGASQLPEALLLPMVHGVAADPQALGRAQDAIARWREHGAALVQHGARVVFALEPEAAQAVAVLRAWDGRFGRFFEGTWWSARRALREQLPRVWPERAAAEFTAGFLDELGARVALAAAWSSLDLALDALHLAHLRPADARAAVPLLQAIEPLLPHAQRAAAMRPAIEAAAAWVDPRGGVAPWRATLGARLALAQRYTELQAAVRGLGGRFPWLGAEPTAALLAATRAAWLSDGPRLTEGDRRMAAARAHLRDPELALSALHRAMPGASPGQIRDGVVKCWARAQLASIEARTPALLRRDAPTPWGDDDATGAALASRHERARSLASRRVIARLDDAALLKVAPALKGRRRTVDQAAREAMLKECRKQRSVMPLRTFVRRFSPDGLLDVLPVWLLSPETLTVLFAQAPLFDLVIFDEASQCTVENGLPVLLRARRALVVGDEQQMPPTSFFKSTGAGSGDDAEPEERQAREVFDAESLLALARTRWERVGLTWHYRCLHEELIAFSNHAMYEGSLRTIPSTASPAAPPALRWVAVPDGRYEGGRNEPEAEVVVNTLHELLGEPDSPSVGVVTFNLVQRAAILDAIDARRAGDAEFARRWEEASSRERLDDRPFVKNLESVQGDERDVIVFSTGHAPAERSVPGRGAERYVPARFGPLGLRGGERRLNVAVSRARRSCVVVSSFEPGMLSLANVRNEGPRLFKVFLEFAWHLSQGRRAQAQALLADRGAARRRGEGEPRVRGWLPLPVQVAAALHALGLQTELDYGSSPARVPLAVMDPRDPTRFKVAVLFDDGAGDRDVFSRWVHTPKVLSMRGWAVVSVDARRWDTQRQAVIASLLAAVNGA